MKSLISFSIVLLFLSIDITAQWHQQTSGTSGNLQSVFFIDENTGWIYEENGSNQVL